MDREFKVAVLNALTFLLQGQLILSMKGRFSTTEEERQLESFIDNMDRALDQIQPLVQRLSQDDGV